MPKTEIIIDITLAPDTPEVSTQIIRDALRSYITLRTPIDQYLDTYKPHLDPHSRERYLKRLSHKLMTAHTMLHSIDTRKDQ